MSTTHPHLDVSFAELKSRFSQEKRAEKLIAESRLFLKVVSPSICDLHDIAENLLKNSRDIQV